jgi:Fic family protein
MRGHFVPKTWKPDPALYASAKYRRPCSYEAFLPDPLEGLDFDLPIGTLGVVSDAERAVLWLNESPQPALAPLARLLLRTESIASSKVEGLQVDSRQLARAEVKAQMGERVALAARQTIGNVDAMQLAVDETARAEKITIDHLTAIHSRLMGRAGRVRSSQNWIGGNDYNPCGADFVPPPPEHVHALLEDLCAAVDADSLPPLVQAAIVHAQFETIHPFDDGNGRVGRALVHVILRRRGLARAYVPPISVALAARRDRYIEGLTHYRMGDVSRWVEQFAAATAHAASLASDYLTAVRHLTAEWRERLESSAAPRSDAAAWALIDMLPGRPVITSAVARAETGRAKSAIHHAIEQLAAAGVLEPLTTSKRNRAWEASGLLELLEGWDAGRLPPAEPRDPKAVPARPPRA